MLNWRREEKNYIRERLREYKEPFIFCLFKSDKNDRLNKFVDNVRLEFRRNKLDEILLEVKKERERIDSVVNSINNEFEDYMYKQNNLISKYNKPFKVKISDDVISPLEQLEVVSIQCEPFKVSFLQEKIGE